MSSVLSAKQVCERALRMINAFPVTDSAADPEHLREAMIWLDLILGEIGGTNRLFFLTPATVQFNLVNGKGQYDLIGALGANAPVDGIQDPVAAYLIINGAGGSILGFSSSIPAGVLLGQTVTDLTTAANIPLGTTIVGINVATNQLTLSAGSTVAAGDSIQIGTTPSPTTLTTTGIVTGTSTINRRPIEIVKRDVFMSVRNPLENGHPRMVYIDRLPDSQLFIHPYPPSTDNVLYSLALDVQTYAPNVAPAGVTGTQPQSEVLTNFRQAWQRYLVFRLSHDLGSGAIFKVPETSLTRWSGVAAIAKEQLDAFENTEHDDMPPICESNDPDYGRITPRFEDRILRRH